MTLIATLRALVCDTLHFYLAAHAAHWNVEGPHFAELHAFFGAIYEDVHGAVDPLAEYLRAHAAEAPGTLTEAAATTARLRPLGATPSSTGGYAGDELVAFLAYVNAEYLTALRNTYEAANEAGDLGLANYLQDRMTAHTKWAWQFRSLLVVR